jgi:hypothetical protein
MWSSNSKEVAPKMGRKSSKSVSPRLHFELISLTKVVHFSRIHRSSLRSTKRANLTFVCGWEEGEKEKPTGMAETSNNKEKRRKHTQRRDETRRDERERERMEGLQGARIFILFTFIPHPHLIRFVNILWTNFVASSIFCMPFDAKGGGEERPNCV